MLIYDLLEGRGFFNENKGFRALILAATLYFFGRENPWKSCFGTTSMVMLEAKLEEEEGEDEDIKSIKNL